MLSFKVAVAAFIVCVVGARKLDSEQNHYSGTGTTQLRLYKSRVTSCPEHRDFHTLQVREIKVLNKQDQEVLITHCGEQCQSNFEDDHGGSYAVDKKTRTMARSNDTEDPCDYDHWLVFDIHAPYSELSEIIIYNRGYEGCPIAESLECPGGDCPCAFLNTEITLEEDGYEYYQHMVKYPHIIYDIKLPMDPYYVAVQEMASQIALAILAGDSIAASVSIAQASRYGMNRAISVAVAIAVADGQEKVVAEAVAKAVICDGNATSISEALTEASGHPEMYDQFKEDLAKEDLVALSNALAQVSEGRVQALAVAHGEAISQIKHVVAYEFNEAVKIGTNAAIISAAHAVAEAAASALAQAGGEVSVKGEGEAIANAATLVKVFAEAIAEAVAEAIAVASVDPHFQAYQLVHALQIALARNLEHATATAELSVGTTGGHVSAYAQSFQDAVASALVEVMVAAFAKLPNIDDQQQKDVV